MMVNVSASGMHNPYSGLKAFRHLDILQGIRSEVPTRPSHVELILYDLCNQNCKFCAYRLEGYASNQRFDDRNKMPTAKALEILDDCKAMRVGAVQFTGGGEPTIHPDFEQIIAYTDSLGLKWSLVSNGVQIGSRNLAPKLTKASWIRISLDAAREETYASMRRCPTNHFGKAKDAIRQLAETKTDCVLGVGFVVNPENWCEVVDCARLAKELGADNFRISAQFSNEDEKLFSSFHQEASDLCKEAETLSDHKFTVFNRFSDRLHDLSYKRPTDRLCGYQLFTTYIGADLNVYRCCGYAYNDHGFVGTVKDKRFRELWMSNERFRNQMDFDARNCDRCQFRHINTALAYALEPQLHEEFV